MKTLMGLTTVVVMLASNTYANQPPKSYYPQASVKNAQVSSAYYLPGQASISAKPAAKIEKVKNPFSQTIRSYLSCEANMVCPELSLDWISENNLLPLSVHVYDERKFEFNQISFIVDGINYSYPVTRANQYRSVNNSVIIDSSNTFNIPEAIINPIRNAQKVDVQIATNYGVLRNSLYKNGDPSPFYSLLSKAR